MKNCCLRHLLRNASASHASRRAKKYVFLSAVLSLALVTGTFYSLDSGNVQVASMREMLMKAPTEEQLDGARINPLYIDDNAVSGVFKLDKELKAGDQQISATFDVKSSNVFVNIYVDGKYAGGRQFKKGNGFKVNLRNPLKVGEKVEIKMYSYTTKSVLEGTAIVGE